MIIALLGLVEGATLSSFWSRVNPPAWLNIAVQCGGLNGIATVIRFGFRKLDELEISEMKWKRGAEGETVVGKIIAGLPDNYYVINDLSTPTGNLDHVVVGPTGVFVLDAKNWRGVVQADGRGELFLNGQPTDTACIRRMVGRLLGVRDKLSNLAGVDVYFDGVFVFIAARVDASWGETGKVNCLREDQLRNYIVEKDFGRRLKPEESEKIAQAFLGLDAAEPKPPVVSRPARAAGVRVSPTLLTGRGPVV